MRTRAERVGMLLLVAGASLQLVSVILERPVADAEGYAVREVGWASASQGLLLVAAIVSVLLLWRWGNPLRAAVIPAILNILWRWTTGRGFGFPSLAGHPASIALLNAADRFGLWLLLASIPLLLIPPPREDPAAGSPASSPSSATPPATLTPPAPVAPSTPPLSPASKKR